jgi:hypothetical protein
MNRQIEKKLATRAIAFRKATTSVALCRVRTVVQGRDAVNCSVNALRATVWTLHSMNSTNERKLAAYDAALGNSAGTVLLLTLCRLPTR